MTRYEVGFMNKCAEYGVDGLAVLDAMRKSAARAPLQKMVVRLNNRLHPKVNPDKLNWFTRLFTKTREFPAFTKREIVPNLSGESGYGPTSTVIRNMKRTTRLSPERILAALGLAGVGTGVGVDALSSGGEAPSHGGSNLLRNSIIGSLALAGTGGAAYAIGKKNKKKKNDDEDGGKNK